MATIDIHMTPSREAAPLSDVGAVDEGTALMFAAERGAIKSIQSWQQRGGNLDTLLIHQAGGSYTPLQLAAFTGHAIAVRSLLAAGMDPSSTASAVASRLGGEGGLVGGGSAPSVGHLPLHLASRYGHAGAVDALLEAGVDPNVADEFGQTALHYGAAYGHLPVCTSLCRHGADVYATEVGGRRADQLAAAAGQGGTAGYLRRLAEAGSSKDGSNTQQIVALLHQQQQQAAAAAAAASAAATAMPPPPQAGTFLQPTSPTAAFPDATAYGGLPVPPLDYTFGGGGGGGGVPSIMPLPPSPPQPPMPNYADTMGASGASYFPQPPPPPPPTDMYGGGMGGGGGGMNPFAGTNTSASFAPQPLPGSTYFPHQQQQQQQQMMGQSYAGVPRTPGAQLQAAASAAAYTVAQLRGNPPQIPPSRQRMRDWLTHLGLPELFPAFMKQGFDDIDFLLSSGGVTPTDCAALGVQAHGIRRKLCSTASLRAFTAQGIMEKWHASVMAAQGHASALATGAQAHQQLEKLRSEALRVSAMAATAAAAKAEEKGGEEEEGDEEDEDEDEEDSDEDSDGDEDSDDEDDEDSDDDDDDEDDDDEDEEDEDED